jgi:DNA-binding beta-propeller fold protein YncE
MEREADAPTRGFPLAEPAWFAVLRALCAVGEGADVIIPVFSIPPAVRTSAAAAAACVAAVLGDPLRRLSIVGGRDGMPRSLASVYGGSVTRFLGGFRGKVSCIIPTPDVWSIDNGVAVSRDGSTLLVSDCWGGSPGVHTFCVHTGVHVRTIGSWGDGLLQFRKPAQIWVASDDHVFVAEWGNNRIQILTPRAFDFHGFVGVGKLGGPAGVCADDAVIVVSEHSAHRISVFSRGDGALLRRFGSQGSGDGQLCSPHGLCFVTEGRHVAVADHNNNRVSVFSMEGEFVQTVGVGKLCGPSGVACSAFNELVVADTRNSRVVVFSASGELHHTMAGGDFTGVAIHGGTIFAQTYGNDSKLVAFT